MSTDSNNGGGTFLSPMKERELGFRNYVFFVPFVAIFLSVPIRVIRGPLLIHALAFFALFARVYSRFSAPSVVIF